MSKPLKDSKKSYGIDSRRGREHAPGGSGGMAFLKSGLNVVKNAMDRFGTDAVTGSDQFIVGLVAFIIITFMVSILWLMFGGPEHIPPETKLEKCQERVNYCESSKFCTIFGTFFFAICSSGAVFAVLHINSIYASFAEQMRLVEEKAELLAACAEKDRAVEQANQLAKQAHDATKKIEVSTVEKEMVSES